MSEENAYQEAQAVGGFIKRHGPAIKVVLGILALCALALLVRCAAG